VITRSSRITFVTGFGGLVTSVLVTTVSVAASDCGLRFLTRRDEDLRAAALRDAVVFAADFLPADFLAAEFRVDDLRDDDEADDDFLAAFFRGPSFRGMRFPLWGYEGHITHRGCHFLNPSPSNHFHPAKKLTAKKKPTFSVGFILGGCSALDEVALNPQRVLPSSVGIDHACNPWRRARPLRSWPQARISASPLLVTM
jgi:hypothetical protein